MKLTVEGIVGAALAEYAEVGYHGLSMRAVARRLDAQVGSLYYHVTDKDELLALMSDRLATEAYAAGTVAIAERSAEGAEGGWRTSIAAQLGALRETLRRHPGGAQLLASGPTWAGQGAFMVSERLHVTLADAGVAASDRAAAVGALLSHVTGFVLREQGGPAGPPTILALPIRFERFPLTFATPDRDEGETFAAEVRLLCAGIATLISR